MFAILRYVIPVLIFMLAPQLAPAQSPDFSRARDETVQTLQGLIRIDTSNPPGNETQAAEFLQSILDQEGIASEVVALEPSRGNLIARIKGNGNKKPLLLMGHTDVVGVERDKWTVGPFAGVIQDGHIYGRGALDDKGMVAAALQVLLMIHRQQIPLDRDIIFLAEAGEEGTPSFGIDFVIDQHWSKIESEFALNEGGRTYQQDGKVQYVGVGTTEKVPNRMRLVARGTSGHGSVPRPDNAIVHLAAAVAKLGQYQAPMRLNETTREFFQRLATISPPEDAYLFTHLEDPVVGRMVQETIRHAHTTYNSMLRTSIAPTIIEGGFRRNVIPAEAEAILDIRALPDEDMAEFTDELRRIIDDPEVELIPLPVYRPASPPSSLESAMFHALEKAQSEVFPGAVTLPLMLTGATDSAQLRAKSVQVYGVGIVATDEDRKRVHGNDERASMEGLGQFLEFLYRAVLEVAAAR